MNRHGRRGSELAGRLQYTTNPNHGGTMHRARTITLGAWTVHRDRARLSARRYPIARGRTLTIIRIGPLCISRYPEPATARTVAQLHNGGA